MRIVAGQPIEVWRTTGRDRHGDGTQVLVGTIEHAVFQWASAASVGLRFKGEDDGQETAELQAVFFLPREEPIRVSHKDRIKMDGRTYQVIGSPAWDEDNPATGYNFGHYMVQVKVVE